MVGLGSKYLHTITNNRLHYTVTLMTSLCCGWLASSIFSVNLLACACVWAETSQATVCRFICWLDVSGAVSRCSAMNLHTPRFTAHSSVQSKRAVDLQASRHQGHVCLLATLCLPHQLALFARQPISASVLWCILVTLAKHTSISNFEHIFF